MKNLSQKTEQIPLSSQAICEQAWSKISPTWPLQNIIACNPLGGLENLNFEQAVKEGYRLFANQKSCPQLEKINQITIKWCQVFFDQGQATIKMPNREAGFYRAWKQLALYDHELHQGKSSNLDMIQNLPDDSQQAIEQILSRLKIKSDQQQQFLTELLTTLAGWSAYVKYLSQWSYYQKQAQVANDYLAIRLIVTAIIWPEAATDLTSLLLENSQPQIVQQKINEIIANENAFQPLLFAALKRSNYFINLPKKKPQAQIVMCIDVRSEPMRRALEALGSYETFGFAGFFGIPTTVSDEITGDFYASCPVLLTPKHDVMQQSKCSHAKSRKIKGYETVLGFKKFYQSLKYNFTTPLPLAEGIGICSGLLMTVRTFFPKGEKKLRNKMEKFLGQKVDTLPQINTIPFEDQCAYATGALRGIGLVKDFADTIIFCGHGSQTENNSLATALDCGACGGRHGDANAKILAEILNQEQVRNHLKENGIKIPETTKFFAAKHNTTTDDIELYVNSEISGEKISQLKSDFLKAKKINNLERAKKMGFAGKSDRIADFFFKRSHSWSETQPEWGLAGNAAFIVAPRKLTQELNLGGRIFLHSYDWEVDEDNAILSLILNAPMVVAQWINSQYLFSTINNVAFGSGSKITQNIVGKIGVMQGNGSDLMHGLSLQSVFFDDQNSYHKPARLTTLVYAPCKKIDVVIAQSQKLQQLFVNEWVMIYCFDPRTSKIYRLQKDLVWSENNL